MLRSRVQLLAVLFPSVLLVQVSGAPHAATLTEAGTGRADDKDLARLLLLEFVSDLMAAKGGQGLPELRAEKEEEEAGEEVTRRHLPLSQRERKAGCRNFFWKTFTSC